MKSLFIYLAFAVFAINVSAQNPLPEMIFVQGGEYLMGNHESSFLDEYPARKVKLNNFYISTNEVTVVDYLRFCRMAGIQEPKGSDNMPATDISWVEAVMYCNWLSNISGLERCYIISRENKTVSVKFIQNAKGYRLPTEAEWEFAARGGVKSKNFAYCGSDTPAAVAWFIDSGKQLQEVGQKEPNELGIYDMSGNALEWCYDFYDNNYYKENVSDNPKGPNIGTSRVCRGGSYSGSAENLRVSKRFYNLPDYRDYNLGFRIVRND